MIGSLKGMIKHKQPPWLLLEVGGVGYEVEAPMSTFYDLPETGQITELHTHFVVREDAQLLFGFSRLNQRALFRLLLKVNSIGPRVALAILSTMSVEDFVHCVHFEDVAQLTSVPGIGKKTAERVLIEMRDKMDTLAETAGRTEGQQPPAAAGSKLSVESDALSALEALGYKPAEALKVIRQIVKSDEQIETSEALIRQALKSLSSKR